MSRLEFLHQRRSHPSRQLADPGPDEDQLRALIDACLRVPDHGKLEPFRILGVRRGTGRLLGERLAQITARRHGNVDAAELEKDRTRFDRAPLCLIVIARLQSAHKIPAQEQLLSAGCVAYNLLLGAQALGFGAQWITGWPAYDREAATLFGLAEDEHAIAFIHIGTRVGDTPERARPSAADKYTEWQS